MGALLLILLLCFLADLFFHIFPYVHRGSPRIQIGCTIGALIVGKDIWLVSAGLLYCSVLGIPATVADDQKIACNIHRTQALFEQIESIEVGKREQVLIKTKGGGKVYLHARYCTEDVHKIADRIKQIALDKGVMLAW